MTDANRCETWRLLPFLLLFSILSFFSAGFCYLFWLSPWSGDPISINCTIMSVDPVTPAEYPPWHDQDEEKDLKEHFDPSAQDAFGNEEEAEVKYKVLAWWYVSCRP